MRFEPERLLDFTPGEQRAVQFLFEAMQSAPREITVLEAARTSAFWAAKLRPGYSIADRYPVSLALRRFRPFRSKFVIEMEAMHASNEFLFELDNYDYRAWPELVKVTPEGPVRKLQNLLREIRETILGDEERDRKPEANRADH